MGSRFERIEKPGGFEEELDDAALEAKFGCAKIHTGLASLLL
jgi:hypothetical protein